MQKIFARITTRNNCNKKISKQIKVKCQLRKIKIIMNNDSYSQKQSKKNK